MYDSGLINQYDPNSYIFLYDFGIISGLTPTDIRKSVNETSVRAVESAGLLILNQVYFVCCR